MEMSVESVPNIEKLRYEGSLEKPDIKIFISHRIDMDSETIDNPLYIPVRCGAIYDDREGVTTLGDDTGDNISKKRNTFCELTVQYWAWKNVQADYYGLHHYRRFLSLSEERFNCKGNTRDIVVSKYLTKESAKKYHLSGSPDDVNVIKQYDGIISECIDVRKVDTPKGRKNTVFEHWKAMEGDLIEEGTLEKTLNILGNLFPEMVETAQEYLNGWKSWGYNCFILKKEFFFALCEFEFPILAELEKQIDITHYSEKMGRTVGYMGEVLFGIFIFGLVKRKISLKMVQMIYFEKATRQEPIRPAFLQKNIPIVLLSSNYYVPYVGVCLKSIAMHSSPSRNYDIIIFQKEITEARKKDLIGAMEAYSNFSIRFVNVEQLTNGVTFYVAASTYSEEANYRVLAPWILQDYEKAIVIDSDLIVKRDLGDLFSLSLKKGCYIGAVRDIVYMGALNAQSYTMDYAVKELRLDNPYEYINTGVQLLNLEGIRQRYTQEEVLELFATHKFAVQEQDGINCFFQGKIDYIDYRWNYHVETNAWVAKVLESAPALSKEEYRSIKNSGDNKPYVVHWANQPKPWNAPSMPWAHEFWAVARESCFYQELLGRLCDSVVQGVVKSTPVKTVASVSREERSGARKLADKVLPIGSRRREVAKVILPKGSRRWAFCKRIYDVLKTAKK